MVTIPDGLTAVTAGLNMLRTLLDVDRSVHEAEFKLKIATVNRSLADAQSALVEAEDELRRKEAELEKLKSALRFRVEETIESNGFFYRKVDGKPVGRAFCPVCLDEGQFLNLNEVAGKGGNSHQCPKCKGNFGSRVHRYMDPASG